MFGRGPFGGLFPGNDFFANPFAHMDRVMGQMFNDPVFGALGPQPAAGRQPHNQYQQTNRQQQRPIIEEVDNEEPGHQPAHDQPIVEEPDDDGSPHDQPPAAQRRRRHSPQRGPEAVPRQQQQQQQQRGGFTADPFSQLFGALGAAAAGAASGGVMGGSSAFVFSSSSYSAGGPGGVTYSASSTTRVGPGGVRETQSVVRDGRSGTERVTIARGLGGRERTLVRTRDAAGRELQHEDLRGIDRHEADEFDDTWRQHAERSLGPGVLGAGGRLGGGGAGRSQRPLALPSSTGHSAGAPAAPAYDTHRQYGSGGGAGSGSGRYRAGADAAAPPPVGRSASATHYGGGATAAHVGQRVGGGGAGGSGSVRGADPYQQRYGGVAGSGQYGGGGAGGRSGYPAYR